MHTEHANDSKPPIGRLAPSPTGYLHLGNAWAFLLAWLAARAGDGSIMLRMEDIDPDRSRPHFAEAILRDLHWLGLNWDDGPDIGGPHAPYVQSQRSEYYAAALHQLTGQGHTYPCYCTRKELRTLAAAPHVGDAGAPYPNTCRSLSPAQRTAQEQAGRRATLRLRCPDEAHVDFIDGIQGPQHMRLHDCGGDFALRRSDGVIAYQLAVVVDDALMGVSQVVRGDDIRISTPRQMLLHALLGSPIPAYAHLPLLLDHTGERLAKRHASLSLGALREAGVQATAIVGYLGYRAGFLPRPARCTPHQLLGAFNLQKIPQASVSLPEHLQNCLLTLTDTLR
ncbi:MAG: tRNA glutamyl-Q(34) synthetase GluQRS [Desulfovibrionaceae bacterium]